MVPPASSRGYQLTILHTLQVANDDRRSNAPQAAAGRAPRDARQRPPLRPLPSEGPDGHGLHALAYRVDPGRATHDRAISHLDALERIEGQEAPDVVPTGIRAGLHLDRMHHPPLNDG